VSEPFRTKFGWPRRLAIAFRDSFATTQAGPRHTSPQAPQPALVFNQSGSQEEMRSRKRRGFIGGVEQGSGL